MSYQQVITGVLDDQYPQPSTTNAMHFCHLHFKFIPPHCQPLLEQYNKLEVLVMTHCHLRNLEHFPRIKNLAQLDLSHNELLGTLRFLMPLTQLTYLDVSFNMIKEESELLPLKRLQKVEVCVKGNPIALRDTWKSRIKGAQLKFVKEPRVIVPPKPIEPKPKLEQVPKQQKVSPKMARGSSSSSIQLPRLVSPPKQQQFFGNNRNVESSDSEMLQIMRANRSPAQKSSSDPPILFNMDNQESYEFEEDIEDEDMVIGNDQEEDEEEVDVEEDNSSNSSQQV